MILKQQEVWKRQKKVRPIIKWTGGKFDEFQMFSNYIPAFEKYFEPFFGGGGVFFALQPDVPAFLNDKSKDLVKFYSLLHSPSFRKELTIYADVWDEAGELNSELTVVLLSLYKKFISDSINTDVLRSNIQRIITESWLSEKHLIFRRSFIIDVDSFVKKLIASVIDKCKRIKVISINEGRIFSDEELSDHIETGIKSGLYLFLRELTNRQFTGQLVMNDEKAASNWYFVREFCYASMFL
jgi:DNA adenine methylase